MTHYTIFEGLTKINEDNSVTPLLAEKWSFSPDLKTLTFTLKPNVKFQDGEPFTSADVKAAFARYAAEDSTNKEKAFFASITAIDTPDPTTVALHFNEPSFLALRHLGLETAVIIDAKSAATAATNPVGTGPYKFGSWTKGASLTLDKWDGYRDAANVPLDHATFRFISDPAAEVTAMLAGDVDVFANLAGRPGARPVQGQPEISGPDRRHRGQDDPCDEQQAQAPRRRARPARDRLRDRPQGDHRRRDGRPRDADRQPSHAERSGLCRLTGLYPHDPEKAKALLKEAGVTTPLDLTLILPPPAYARQGGQIIAAELAEVGINAKIQKVEWAQWLRASTRTRTTI